jgi:hypothetical protein
VSVSEAGVCARYAVQSKATLWSYNTGNGLCYVSDNLSVQVNFMGAEASFNFATRGELFSQG